MAVEGFLKTIIDIKQAEVSRLKADISHTTMRQEAEATPAPPDFLSAMKAGCKDDIGIIAEMKKASPSKGVINPDLDPEKVAQIYTKGGAKAISVLTESHYFKGSVSDLEIVCCNTPLPVLRKDFILSSYQIFEAKRAGASTILLITTMLSPNQLTDYIELCREIHMEPLVEVMSEYEFETAYACGAKVVDINNRNLQTLKTDLGVSKRISAIIPDDIIPVEASGIKSHEDIQNGLEHGIYNFLVGESIVRSTDPVQFIHALKNKNMDDVE